MQRIKTLLLTLLLLTLFTLSGCAEKDPNTIEVGTIAGPETELVEAARTIMKEKYGLNLKIVTFTDYNMPNLALDDGSLDANVFQTIPFLQNQIKNRNYQIVSIGKTFIYPMALYSKRYRKLTELPDNVKIAIPSDPSNEARALLLLQKAGLIKLKPGTGIEATPLDIDSNPKEFKFIQLDAAQLVRSLHDVALAAINTNYAKAGGLSPKKNGLFIESKDSPYANIIVVRSQDKNNKRLLNLVKALHSKPVLQKAKQLFGDGAVVAF